MNTTFDLDFDLATPPLQAPEERAQQMLERARRGLQVNQRRYEKARRRQRWDQVADSLGRIERAEQASRRWQQELDRIRSSQGPYRFENRMDNLLDEATYLERGIHGYFPFSRSMYGRRGYACPTARGSMSRFEDDDLDALIDRAQPRVIPGGEPGRPWTYFRDQAHRIIDRALRGALTPVAFHNQLDQARVRIIEAIETLRRSMSGTKRRNIVRELNRANRNLESAQRSIQVPSTEGDPRQLARAAQENLQRALRSARTARRLREVGRKG
jgi:hypothetical protein